MRKIFVAAMKIGVASLASLVGWMIAGKILALSLGAVGIGLFGLLRQLLQNLNVLATLNGQNALVQGVSIRQEAARSQYVRSIFSLQLLFSGTVAAVLVLGAPWIGPRLLPHPSSPELIRWLALAVVALSFQTYFTGLLTGHQALDKLVRSQMLGPLTVVLLALPMSALLRGGHPVGFVVMLFIPSLVVGTYQARLCIAGGWLTWRGTRWLAWEDAQSFLTMSLTILVAGLVVTSVDYARNWLVAFRLGMAQAGYFWVAWVLSMTYVTLILGAYGTYYLPALSRLETPAERNGFIRNYLHMVLLVMPVVITIVIVLKPLLVRWMFSANLLPALGMMRWMLIGDFFKGVSWVLGIPMLAFRQLRWFLYSEIVFSVIPLGLVWAFLHAGVGIECIGVIFLGTYIAHFVFTLWYVYRVFQFSFRRPEWIAMALGALLVIGMSLLFWNSSRLSLLPVLGAFASVLTFAVLALGCHRQPGKAMPLLPWR